MRFRSRLSVLLVCLAAIIISPALSSAADSAKPAGKTVILWISDDGFRGDYVDRDQTPFLASLMEHGVYTKQLTPAFPSLTFPSHTTEATGVTAGVHGIVSNKFFDATTGKDFDLPTMGPNQMLAEPIWQTATRQGVRTAVWDWPLSSNLDTLPAGAVLPTIFDRDKFDSNETDEQRLEKLVDAYRKDCENPVNHEPLRLLMGYAFAVDHVGHGDGPESEGTTKAIHQVDGVLQKIVGEVADIFNQHMHPDHGDALYVLITTDHGMETIKTLVNLKHLMGRSDIPAPDPVRADWAGSLANIYLNDVPGDQRDTVKKSVLENLRRAPFQKCWAREELPEKFGYANPTRTGDIVVSLAPGYYFTKNDISAPMPAESEPRSLKGMHGYDATEDDKMLGFAVLTKWGSTAPGKDLGPVSTLEIHPTVAKLLGIQPAQGATTKPIETP